VSLKKLNSLVSHVNLCDLQKLCDANVLSANQEVNLEILKKVGIVRDNSTSVRLLAKGELKVALQISVGYASDAAIRGVEAAGGKVQVGQ
jgi:large subunit ribosomal protein L15